MKNQFFQRKKYKKPRNQKQKKIKRKDKKRREKKKIRGKRREELRTVKGKKDNSKERVGKVLKKKLKRERACE